VDLAVFPSSWKIKRMYCPVDVDLTVDVDAEEDMDLTWKPGVEVLDYYDVPPGCQMAQAGNLEQTKRVEEDDENHSELLTAHGEYHVPAVRQGPLAEGKMLLLGAPSSVCVHVGERSLVHVLPSLS